PGVKEEPAVGPVAPSLPQLPQVSQFRVSSTLSSTVVPALGTGVAVATGVGLGAAPGPAEAGALLFAVGLPPQELRVNDTDRIARAKKTKFQRRNTVPPENDLVWTKWRRNCKSRAELVASGKGPNFRAEGF